MATYPNEYRGITASYRRNKSIRYHDLLLESNRSRVEGTFEADLLDQLAHRVFPVDDLDRDKRKLDTELNYYALALANGF